MYDKLGCQHINVTMVPFTVKSTQFILLHLGYAIIDRTGYNFRK